MRAWKGAILIATLGLTPVVEAQDTCSDPNQYSILVAQGYDKTTTDDLDGALELYGQAQDLCPGEPLAIYAEGRVRIDLGECKRASKMLKGALDKYEALEAPVGNITAERVKDRLIEAVDRCVPRASYAIQCEQEGVMLSVDGGEPQSCPAKGETTPGYHSVRAELEGHIAKPEIPMPLDEGRGNVLIVEALEKIKPNEGILSLTCPGAIKVVQVQGDALEEELTVPCPSEQRLPPGQYLVRIPGREDGQSVPVVKGETTSLLVKEMVVAEEKTGLFIALRGGGGAGYVGSRPLYDKNNDNEVSTLSEDDSPQPTLLTGNVTNDIGYYFLDSLGAGVRLRFGFPNFSFTGEAFLRWIPWQNDIVGIRTDLGVGGGEILAAFQFSGGTDRCANAACIARIDPFFASLAISVNFKLSSVFSLVVMTEARLFLPDVAGHFDFVSGGVEVFF